ncbi:nitroreductase [Coriobacteriales bacterium OH1046]|nr:nitroreductase [Coriobacteriales bacterium OH1046]
MAFLELAKRRFSVRSFAPAAVEDDKLTLVLEARRIAPTAANKQPQRIFVIHAGSEAMDRLCSATSMIYGAPVALVVCWDTEAVWHNKREAWRRYTSGDMDCSIVATHMMLQATELGLGTLWVRGFDARDIHEALELDDALEVSCIIDVGYAAEGCTASPHHEIRFDLEHSVSALSDISR